MSTVKESNTAYSPDRCPLCGGPNQCGLAAGSTSCWCFTTRIPDAVVERVPVAARNVACVCPDCAAGRASPAVLEARLAATRRER